MPVTISGGSPTFSSGYQGGTIISGTAQASTSGTAITFTSIPSWVKRITIMLAGVSTNGSTAYLVQLGTSSGFVTSGYLGAVSREGTVGSTNFSTGFQITGTIAGTSFLQGNVVLTNITSNTWTENSQLGYSDGAATAQGAGYLTLSGVLTQVRVTTVNGTDVFDAGTINILYE